MKNTTYQSIWDGTKVVLREKNCDNKCLQLKRKKSHINNLILYLKELEKGYVKTNVYRKKEKKILEQR